MKPAHEDTPILRAYAAANAAMEAAAQHATEAAITVAAVVCAVRDAVWRFHRFYYDDSDLRLLYRFSGTLALFLVVYAVAVQFGAHHGSVGIVEAPTHKAREHECALVRTKQAVDLYTHGVAMPECGAVVHNVEGRGRTLYCLAGKDDQAPLALHDVEDLTPVSGTDTLETLEADEPCPSTPLSRVRYAHVRATFHCCPPMNITGHQARCLQHFFEVERVGWACQPRASP